MLRDVVMSAGSALAAIWSAAPCARGSAARAPHSTQGQPREYTGELGRPMELHTVPLPKRSSLLKLVFPKAHCDHYVLLVASNCWNVTYPA